MKVRIAALLVLLLASSSAVNAATIADFIAACGSWSNLEESICECMAEKAKKAPLAERFRLLGGEYAEEHCRDFAPAR